MCFATTRLKSSKKAESTVSPPYTNVQHTTEHLDMPPANADPTTR